MADTLSEEERALIEVAVAAGRVRRVPTGRSALAVEYRWTGKKLEIGDAAQAKLARGSFSFGRNPDPSVAQRRARVAELRAEGMTGPQIAEAVGATPSVIWADLKRLGLSKPRKSGAKA